MEKVTLYDPEKDIVVDINVSPDDFLRAQQGKLYIFEYYETLTYLTFVE